MSFLNIPSQGNFHCFKADYFTTCLVCDGWLVCFQFTTDVVYKRIFKIGQNLITIRTYETYAFIFYGPYSQSE